MTTEAAIIKLKEAVQLLEFEDGGIVKQLQEIIAKLENKYYEYIGLNKNYVKIKKRIKTYFNRR